jgi:hypothetical protein
MMSILVKVILVLHVAFPPSSFKSSPMLSMLLSVEELESLEIILPCVWESSSLPAFVTYLSFNFFLLSSSHVPILCHIIITDFYLVLVAASSSTDFLLLPQQNIYWNTPQSWSSWNYLSNEPPFAWNRFRTRDLCLLYSGATICPKLISDAQRSMFLPYILVRVFKIDNSWCIGKMVLRSFWILTFLPLYISEHMLKYWWKQRLPSQAL